MMDILDIFFNDFSEGVGVAGGEESCIAGALKYGEVGASRFRLAIDGVVIAPERLWLSVSALGTPAAELSEGPFISR